MEFYNRDSELKELLRMQKLSFDDYLRMTVITGRRRIGITSIGWIVFFHNRIVKISG